MPPVQINYVLFLSDEVSDLKAKLPRKGSWILQMFRKQEGLDLHAMFLAACNGTIELLPALEAGHDKAGVVLECFSTKQCPVPDKKSLDYFGRGLDVKSLAALGKAKTALAVTGVGPFDAQHKLLRDLTRAVSQLSRDLDAIVFDAADSLTFTPAAFKQIRATEAEAGQFSPAQFGVRAYRVDGGLRSVSMGLEKFGQPNLVLPIFAEHHMTFMDHMMTLAMQHIIQAEKPITPGILDLRIEEISNPRIKQRLAAAMQFGGAGTAKLQLRVELPLQGDPVLLLAPVFQSAPGPQLWAEQAELLKQLFGKDREVSTNVNFDETIESAIKKARQEAMQILSDPSTWQKPDRRISVAVALQKIKQIVWLEARSWQNGAGKGILISDLQVPGLNSGDSMPFAAENVMDYRLMEAELLVAQGGIDDMVRKLRS